MSTLQNFNVTFPYGAKDGKYYGPKGSVGPYHRGNDRACDKGTPVVICGVTIGKTGKTGLAGGYHCHTQAGTDLACQKDINPGPYEFQPGIVVATGTGKTWGKYVTIKVGSRYITYCHLDEILVNKGLVISVPPIARPQPSTHRYQYAVGRVLKLTPRDGKWKFYKPGSTEVAYQFRGLNGEAWKVLGVGSMPNRVVVNSAVCGGRAEVPLASASGVEYAGEFRII